MFAPYGLAAPAILRGQGVKSQQLTGQTKNTFVSPKHVIGFATFVEIATKGGGLYGRRVNEAI
jgi:hypothetical protein